MDNVFVVGLLPLVAVSRNVTVFPLSAVTVNDLLPFASTLAVWMTASDDVTWSITTLSASASHFNVTLPPLSTVVCCAVKLLITGMTVGVRVFVGTRVLVGVRVFDGVIVGVLVSV